MRLPLLLALLLLPGCATLEESLFGGQSSFVRTNRQVGSAIEIGRDEWAHYAVAYLPENVRRSGDEVTIMTEWITIPDGSSTRRVFVLDCRGKRFRISRVGYGNAPLQPSLEPDRWMPINTYTGTSEKAVYQTFCS